MSGSATDSTLASTLDALASYARAFDEISEADGACYSAAAFVEDEESGVHAMRVSRSTATTVERLACG